MFQQNLTTTFMIAELLAFMFGATLVALAWHFNAIKISRNTDEILQRLREAAIDAVRHDLREQDLKLTLAYGYMRNLPSIDDAADAWHTIMSTSSRETARTKFGRQIVAMYGLGKYGHALSLRGRIRDNAAEFAVFMQDEDGFSAIDYVEDPQHMSDANWKPHMMDAMMDLVEHAITTETHLMTNRFSYDMTAEVAPAPEVTESEAADLTQDPVTGEIAETPVAVTQAEALAHDHEARASRVFL